MDSKHIAFDINKILSSAESLIAKIESGEGLNVPAEKMEEYKKALANSDVSKLKIQLQEKVEDFKKQINKNGTTN